MLTERIEQYIKNEFAQCVSSEENFFFKKGQDALNKWINTELPPEQMDSIISLSLNYNEFKKIDSSNRELFPIVQLLFEIVSYCDNKANGKKHYNQYEDSRTFANAGVRMGAWIRNLVEYKYNSQNVTGSIKNAFNYLLDPTNNTTILSENHRKLIVEYFLKKDYKPVDFTDDCKNIFKNYNLTVLNDENYTFYISSLIYNIGDEWKPIVSLKFKDLVKKLEKHFISEKIEFSFDKLSSRPRYVWISDNSKDIGNHIAHYEIGFRSISTNKNQIYVDIHFESTLKAEKDIFHNIIKILPENLEWFDWQGSKSIGYKEVYKLDDADIVDNITTALEYIEDNLGDSIRKIISQLSPSNTIKLESMEQPLNQILYGPPGTGKTYKLLNEYFNYFRITDKTINKEEYETEIISKLNWWQIITLVLLEGEAKVPDIKKHRYIKYKLQVSNTKSLNQTMWGQLSSHTIQESETVKYTRRFDPLFFDKSDDSTWSIIEKKKELIDDLTEIASKINDYKENKVTANNYKFITFHQSFSYEDFVEGIKPVMNEESSEENINYSIEKGIFYNCCDEAAKLAGFISLKDAIENYSQSERVERFKSAKPYGIFIDEINRGNISQIFGELITLIEEDKRLGESEIILELPYSKNKFGVPPNLFIIGTMNTADRSVEALDTALRRRFSFTEVMPKPKLLKEISFKSFNLDEVLQTINERLEVLLDRDHTIGHSYFMKVNSNDTKELTSVFQNCIIPLLQEYFYHDYEKIALILGSGFVKFKENKEIKFASFEGLGRSETTRQFELIKDITNVENAVLLLLNNNG